MSAGWEPDDVVAVIDTLAKRFGESALQAVDFALSQSAAAWGRELAAADNHQTTPQRFVAHFTSGPQPESCLIESGEDSATIETARCSPYNIFKQLGRLDVGYRFKCSQDPSIIAGYDAGITLEVQSCMMTGDKTCIHRYSRRRT